MWMTNQLNMLNEPKQIRTEMKPILVNLKVANEVEPNCILGQSEIRGPHFGEIVTPTMEQGSMKLMSSLATQ